MNQTELAANPTATERVVHDLDARSEPAVPGRVLRRRASAACRSTTWSGRSRCWPEAARVLRPGAPVVITFSNRCFPTKAITGGSPPTIAGRRRHRGRLPSSRPVASTTPTSIFGPVGFGLSRGSAVCRSRASTTCALSLSSAHTTSMPVSSRAPNGRAGALFCRVRLCFMRKSPPEAAQQSADEAVWRPSPVGSNAAVTGGGRRHRRRTRSPSSVESTRRPSSSIPVA